MPRPLVTQTITYRSPNTLPPVSVAGSFSEPKWTPLDMTYTRNTDGQYVFTRNVRLVPEREYQFKFRLGTGDKWVINDEYPTTYDDNGNQINSLKIKLNGAQTIHRSMQGKVLSDKGIVNTEDSPATNPADDTAKYENDMADTVGNLHLDSKLDGPDHLDTDGAYSCKEAEPIISPLFAHESFGAYEFVNDSLDQDESVAIVPRLSKTASEDRAGDDIDLNDPMIEEFPSERGSVLNALRKIQSSSSDDHLQAEKAAMSPFLCPRRRSDDSATEDNFSTESTSPTNFSTVRKRDAVPSHSSIVKTKSAISLDSIAEEEPKEPRPDGYTAENTAQDANLPRGAVFEGLDSGPSDEDEGVVLRSTKADPFDKTSHQVKKWFGVTG